MRTPFLALFLLLSVSAAFAQIPNATDTTTTPLAGAHDYLGSPVETVNPANGSTSIRIPVRMPPGRQLAVPFSFAYDSNGAFFIGPPNTPNGGAPRYQTITTNVNSQGGWSFSFPVMSFQVGSWQIPGSNDNLITCHGSFNYVFQDPGGNRHNLGLSVSGNYTGGNGQNCADGLNGDGEFPTGSEGPISASTSIPGNIGSVFPGTTVVDGNGTTYGFPGGSANTYLASSVVDRNGNAVGISNSSGVTYTDTIGRTALHTSGLGGNPDTITLAGLSSPYKVYWTSDSASFTDNMTNECTGAGCQACPTSLSATSIVVSSIVLPNGKQFTLTYEHTYGMLQKLVYPTGGYVRYVWGLNPQAEQISTIGFNGQSQVFWDCRYDFPAITDRYVSSDGSTEVLHQHLAYSTNWSTNTKQTTVTTYDLVRNTSFTTVYTYSLVSVPYVPNCTSCTDTQSIPLEKTIQYNDTSGSTLETVTKGWKNIRLLSSQQTQLNNGVSSLAVYCYDANEQNIETDEYDFGTNTPTPPTCSGVPVGTQSGSLLRKTTTTYASFSGIHIDLTGVFCTSGSERGFHSGGSWYADETVQAGTGRHAAAAN